jgi:hypothetical protein
MDERQPTTLDTANDSHIINRYHLLNPQAEIITSLQLLENFTGRSEWLQTLPNISAVRTELQNLQNKPLEKIDAHREQLEKKVMAIRVNLRHQVEQKLRDNPDSTTANAPIDYKKRITDALETLGVEVRARSTTDICDIQGSFEVIDGKPIILFNGLANLAHEAEHLLQWLELDKEGMSRKSTLGELREAYAQMAAMYCYREHGYATGVTPVVDNNDITPRELMETVIGIGNPEFDDVGLLTLGTYPLL